MSALPPELLAIILAVEGTWTAPHAADSRDELGLEWEDVEEVARAAEWYKRTRDRKAGKGYIHAMRGRDRSGRLLYTAGKVLRYQKERYWHVVTIHLSD